MAELNAEDRGKFSTLEFAFPKQRKERLEDANYVRNAVARFDQVKGVADAERNAAWKRIEVAVKKFGVELHEPSWRQLGKLHHGR